MLELPPLYSRDLNDNIIVWQTRAEGDVVIYEHGRLGGKLVKNRTRCFTTNRGQSNERNGNQQALFEAQAAWQKKKKTGYQETVEAARTAVIILPMLAHSVIKRLQRSGGVVEEKRELTFPLDAQFKFNGLRCLARCEERGVIEFISRENEHWDGLSHIRRALANLMVPGEILDGEIYCHGMALEEINSLVKLERIESGALWFQMYDTPTAGTLLKMDEPWEVRYDHLSLRYAQFLRSQIATSNALSDEALALAFRDHISKRAMEGTTSFLDGVDLDKIMMEAAKLPLQLTPTWTVLSEQEIKVLALRAIEDGYEGLILRPLDKPYVLHKRVDSLIKWKDFQDGEFTIIDSRSIEWFEQSGRSMPILDVFVVQNDCNALTFEVKPRGTVVDKHQMWEDRDDYLGRRITVRYSDRSQNGVPQGNPVGFFREEEDLPGADDMSMWE